MNILEEVRAKIGAGAPVTDAELLACAGRLLQDMEAQLAALQAENEQLRAEVNRCGPLRRSSARSRRLR